MLKVCIDSNIYISAIGFGGRPLEILDLAFDKKFHLITSMVILNEVKRNLIEKILLPHEKVNKYIINILSTADLYEPLGELKLIDHKNDSLVLETAILGSADVLVTGDKKDLLPLKNFHGVEIENPNVFLSLFYQEI